jgi:predicted permease
MWTDLRYAGRRLAASPLFTAVAVLSLALGIGANTAMFSLVDQILLRLLPVDEPRQLVLIDAPGPKFGRVEGRDTFSHPMYLDLRDRNQTLSGLAARYGTNSSFSAGSRTERVRTELVSGNYFEVLGVRAARGRLFTRADDETPGGHPVAVLNYRFWKNRLGADPDIVNQKVLVNGYPMTVLGVAAEGFDGLDQGAAPAIFVPVTMKARMTPGNDGLDSRRYLWLQLFGRLKPGTALEQANADLGVLFKQNLDREVNEEMLSGAEARTRQAFLEQRIEAVPGSQGRSQLRRNASTPLLVLMGVVAFVLLIACANVANLMLARAAARQKEIAVRLSLGGSRGRIARQLLVESLLLGTLGGLAGLVVASWAIELLLQALPDAETLTLTATPDGRILAFNFALALFTGLLFGLYPAWQASRQELSHTLKDQAGSVLGGGSAALFRRAMIVSQVTLSVLLLIGAGLFVRTLRNLRAVDLGVRPERLVSFTVHPSLNGYDGDRSRQFFDQLIERLRGLPGVRAVGSTTVPVIEGHLWSMSLTIPGFEAGERGEFNANMSTISPGYFETMGIPLLAGRDFTLRDDGRSGKFAIVNETFAKFYFGGPAQALGARFAIGRGPDVKPDIEIAGVVKDSRYTEIREVPPRQFFLPYRADAFVNAMTVYVRAAENPNALFLAVRREVAALDGDLPVYAMRTFEQQIDRALVAERLVATLSTGFGLLAALLAGIGLYGTLAYMVARRTREIGVRMALGASTENVTWLVAREVLVLTVTGSLLGVPAAYGLARLLQSKLYGIAPADFTSYVAALSFLGIVAMAAATIPARRAARIDPLDALRYE